MPTSDKQYVIDYLLSIVECKGVAVIDYNEIQQILQRWDEVLDTGEINAKLRAEKTQGGLMGRIKRVSAQPIIFDIDAYHAQKAIQHTLCKVFPQWSDIILSIPEIMDGYHWIRKDFIELYFEHFRLVNNKLRQIICRENVL